MAASERPSAPRQLARLRIDVHLDGQGLLATMADEVRQGLTASQKYLLPKYFYDARGSELFERITEQPEYYLTQTEHELLARLANELMATLRPHELVELGSGSSSKTRVLLDAASAPQHLRRYVPFDVSESMVHGTAQELLDAYPFLEVHGVIGDFERHLDRISPPTGGRLVLFLGSTIGNLEPGERRRFLSGVRALLGSEGRLLLGLDLVKDLDALNAAYNDDDGVTAEFNRNILQAVNNALQADFAPAAFEHRAFFNADASRIEMHLVPGAPQTVHLGGLGLTVHVAAGESIWTENSYKFTEESAAAALAEAGMRLERWCTDAGRRFGLALAASA